MHISSYDFASMISPEQFGEFVLPVIEEEAELADHNIFHMDGKCVTNHVDVILEIPEFTVEIGEVVVSALIGDLRNRQFRIF